MAPRLTSVHLQLPKQYRNKGEVGESVIPQNSTHWKLAPTCDMQSRLTTTEMTLPSAGASELS